MPVVRLKRGVLVLLIPARVPLSDIHVVRLMTQLTQHMELQQIVQSSDVIRAAREGNYQYCNFYNLCLQRGRP